MWDMPLWWWCVLGAALMPLSYLGWLGSLHVNAWLGRGEKPRDRVVAFVVMSAVLGACLGGGTYWLKERFRPCHESGLVLGHCLIEPR